MNTNPNNDKSEDEKTASLTSTEEWAEINEQIRLYLEQRNTALTVVAAGIGGVLALSSGTAPFSTALALFALTISGALITLNASFQANRRAAYLHVFIESSITNLKFYTRLGVDGRQPLQIHFTKGKVVKVPVHVVPSEYTVVYVIFDVTALSFAIVQRATSSIVKCLICAVLFMATLTIAWLIHAANTAPGYARLIQRWKAIKEMEE